MPEPRFEPRKEPATANCEYLLVDYAPSPLRDTRIAIGLFLVDAAGRLVQQGFTQDWRRVRCLDPQADIALLANLPQYFERQIGAATPGAPLTDIRTQLLHMREEFSGSIQIGQPRGVLTADPVEEFQRLFQEHVERPVAARESRPAREGSRPWIRARLAEAIQRHNLWDRFSKDIPVQEFTAPGDGFRIDFGYRPNGVTKYMHAIALDRDWNQSKLLSYTFWRIREKSKAEMTAIVGDTDSDFPLAQSCRQILAGAQISTLPLSQIDSYLEKVSSDLQ